MAEEGTFMLKVQYDLFKQKPIDINQHDVASE